MSPAILKIYVASNTGATTRLMQLVDQMVRSHLGGKADISVVDVLVQPEEAENGHVLITPTIDCLAPLPQRRVIGMPSNADELADALLLRNYVTRKDNA